MSPRDRLFLQHIVEAIDRIGRFTTEGRAEFMRDEKTQSAVVRQLEVIGEAAKQVSEDVKNGSTDLPWREMAATRDRLIHGYFTVKLEVVWTVVEKDLPLVREGIMALLQSAGG